MQFCHLGFNLNNNFRKNWTGPGRQQRETEKFLTVQLYLFTYLERNHKKKIFFPMITEGDSQIYTSPLDAYHN